MRYKNHYSAKIGLAAAALGAVIGLAQISFASAPLAASQPPLTMYAG